MPAADVILAPQSPRTDDFVPPHRDNVLVYYLGDVFDWHGYVKFLSLAALRETSRDVPLEKLFVEPHVAPQYLSPDAMDAATPPSTEALSDALAAHPRLVLLGDPGSGKSTVVNWICTLLNRSVDGPLAARLGGPLVPLPFVLRELGLGRDFAALKDAGQRWERLRELFLARPVAAHLATERKKHARLEESLLGRMLTSGQAMFLLDGIDEIGSVEVRRALREAIHEGMRRYPRCRWVLTSRIVGYEEVEFDWLNVPVESPPPFAPELDGEPASWRFEFIRQKFARPSGQDFARQALATRLYLAPFDNGQVERFTRLWWAHHEGNPHLAGTKPGQFLTALRQSDGARSLGRLPHLLTMIAQIYRVIAELPDGRAKLYGLIADTYLGTLDKERGLEHLRPIPYTVEDMTRWLAAIGWHLQRRRGEKKPANKDTNEVLIPEDELLDLLADIIPPKPGGPTAKETARLFLEYAGRRSGLLLPRGVDVSGGNRYAFLHLSFQEYFAAQFLRDRVSDPDWLELAEENARHGTSLENLQGYAGQTPWRETLIFLWESAALNNPMLPQRLIVRLCGWPREEGKWGSFLPPTAEQMTKERVSEWKPLERTVALVAALSVNPHVTLTETAREALWDRCWRWELARQASAVIGDRWNVAWENPVARQLLSRPGCERQSLTTLADISKSRQQTELSLSGCTALSDLKPLAGLGQLQMLSLSGCTALSDLKPLAGLGQLQMLSLAGCTALSDLKPLAGLGRQFKTLILEGCTALSDLGPLAGLGQLQMLSLSGCTALSDLKPLAGLGRQFKTLFLAGCTALSDLKPLAGLGQLHTLSLSGCTALSDLKPLAGLGQLQMLSLVGCTALEAGEVEKLREALPKVRINGP